MISESRKLLMAWMEMEYYSKRTYGIITERKPALQMSQQRNIQDIVRAVVANLGNLPSGSSSHINSSTNSTYASNLNTNTSTSEELNRSFHIPRGSRPLASGFYLGKIMARLWEDQDRGDQWCKHPGQAPVADFNHTALHLRLEVVTEPMKAAPIIWLLPSPTWEWVLRGKVKINLIQKDMHIDTWPVCRGWDESMLRREVGRLFRQVLNLNVAEPIE